MDHKGVPKGCGICEFLTVEGMLKCLRLLKGLKIEEDYELSVNLGQKTEAFLRYWRESKKYEWIEAKHRAGLDVDMKEIERKESQETKVAFENRHVICFQSEEFDIDWCVDKTYHDQWEYFMKK